MGSLTVVNRNTKAWAWVIRVNVMRGTPLGNPYNLNKKMDRVRSIALYRRYLWKEIKNKNMEILNALNDIADLVEDGEHVELECCCKPKACHGDIIKAAVEWLLIGGAS